MSNLFGSSLSSICPLDSNVMVNRQCYPRVTLQGQPNRGRLILNTAPQPHENLPTSDSPLSLTSAPVVLPDADSTPLPLALNGAVFDATALTAARNLNLPTAANLAAARHLLVRLYPLLPWSRRALLL